MNSYEAKIEARKNRLHARAEAQAEAANAKIAKAERMLGAIPFGQPVHGVRDANYRDKARDALFSGVAMAKKARETARLAETAGTAGISSDDPDAIAKIQDRIAEIETEIATMKAENAAWRKAGNSAGRQPNGGWVDPPHPSFEFTNRSANVRRLKARVEQLTKTATRGTSETTRDDGIRICRNAEENRLQLIFPEKPDADTISRLKRYGFRWSPRAGAWQRQLNNSAEWAAQEVLRAKQ